MIDPYGQAIRMVGLHSHQYSFSLQKDSPYEAAWIREGVKLELSTEPHYPGHVIGLWIGGLPRFHLQMLQEALGFDPLLTKYGPKVSRFGGADPLTVASVSADLLAGMLFVDEYWKVLHKDREVYLSNYAERSKVWAERAGFKGLL